MGHLLFHHVQLRIVNSYIKILSQSILTSFGCIYLFNHVISVSILKINKMLNLWLRQLIIIYLRLDAFFILTKLYYERMAPTLVIPA